MRKLYSTVLLAACLGLVACGGDGGGDKENQGQGGSGGSGGSGGTGGEAGGGGPSCGDGTLDEGEACDDGNKAGGDGCSANCLTIEGKSCDTPINYNFVSTLDANRIRSYGTTLDGASTIQGSCGGDGSEVFFEYTAARSGILNWVANPQGQAIVYVLDSCGGEELSCLDQGLGELEVVQDQKLIFVVDSAATQPNLEIELLMQLQAILAEGDGCDVNGSTGLCDTGLYCGQDETRNYVCLPNHAPVMDSITAVRSGADLTVTANGSDEDRNVVKVWIAFLDSNGTIIPLDDSTNPPVTEGYIEMTQGMTAITFNQPLEGFYNQFPQFDAATSIEAWFEDNAAGLSTHVTAPITDGSNP